MPFVEATMIAGYPPDVKQRLVTAFTRGVLSVMSANPDGVIVVLREVEPSNWARGGVSRVPGPPLPYAVDVVRECLAAIAGGQTASAEPDVVLPHVVASDYQGFDECYAQVGSLVFCEGTIDGQPIIDRFLVVGGKIAGFKRWGQ